MDATGGEATAAERFLLASQWEQNREDGRQKEADFLRMDTGQKREMSGLQGSIQTARRLSERRVVGITEGRKR